MAWGGGGVVGNADAGGCVDLDPASFDTSCQADSDCEPIYYGTICPGWTCACSNAAINIASLSSYQQVYRTVPPETGDPCECPASVGGPVRCVAHECVMTRNSN
jgi:hypothetical protein